MTHLLELNHNNIDFLLTNLLKEEVVSSIVKKYFKLIEGSVDNQGKARLNPLTIAFSLPFLIGKNYGEFFDNSWFDRYSSMLRLYFGAESRFYLKKWVKKYVLSLLLNDFLTFKQRQSLYQIYLDDFQDCVDSKLINNLFNWIKETEVHGIFGNWKAVEKSLALVDKSAYQIVFKFSKDRSVKLMINMPKMREIIKKQPTAKKYRTINIKEIFNIE